MAVEKDLIKTLNLLRTQPKFVLHEKEDRTLNVLSVNRIPDGDGFYWVAGSTILRSGIEIPSVFVIDTDSGAEQYNVYWYVDGEWFQHSDSESAANRLGIPREDIFPFSWRYHVPVEKDIHK
jgi:hypothetical protein